MFESLDEVVIEAVRKVFETSAFMKIMGKESGDVKRAPLDAGAVISFHGPFSGRATLRIASSQLPEMAANMLGKVNSRRISDELQRDALQEVLNMICGNVLTGLAGEEAVFELGLPEYRDFRSADSAPSGVCIPFALENTRAELFIDKETVS